VGARVVALVLGVAAVADLDADRRLVEAGGVVGAVDEVERLVQRAIVVEDEVARQAALVLQDVPARIGVDAAVEVDDELAQVRLRDLGRAVPGLEAARARAHRLGDALGRRERHAAGAALHRPARHHRGARLLRRVPVGRIGEVDDGEVALVPLPADDDLPRTFAIRHLGYPCRNRISVWPMRMAAPWVRRTVDTRTPLTNVPLVEPMSTSVAPPPPSRWIWAWWVDVKPSSMVRSSPGAFPMLNPWRSGHCCPVRGPLRMSSDDTRAATGGAAGRGAAAGRAPGGAAAPGGNWGL